MNALREKFTIIHQPDMVPSNKKLKLQTRAKVKDYWFVHRLVLYIIRNKMKNLVFSSHIDKNLLSTLHHTKQNEELHLDELTVDSWKRQTNSPTIFQQFQHKCLNIYKLLIKLPCNLRNSWTHTLTHCLGICHLFLLSPYECLKDFIELPSDFLSASF